MARQARIQHAYEDRIASLRSQVDRITSRQLLDQQIMDDKMTRLMEQQAMLSTRHGRLDNLLKRADVVELVPTNIPIPQAKPSIDAPQDDQQRAGLKGSRPNADDNASLEPMTEDDNATVTAFVAAPSSGTEDIFDNVLFSLQEIEQETIRKIQKLTSNAFQTQKPSVPFCSRLVLHRVQVRAWAVRSSVPKTRQPSMYRSTIWARRSTRSKRPSRWSGSCRLPVLLRSTHHQRFWQTP